MPKLWGAGTQNTLLRIPQNKNSMSHMWKMGKKRRIGIIETGIYMGNLNISRIRRRIDA